MVKVIERDPLCQVGAGHVQILYLLMSLNDYGYHLSCQEL